MAASDAAGAQESDAARAPGDIGRGAPGAAQGEGASAAAADEDEEEDEDNSCRSTCCCGVSREILCVCVSVVMLSGCFVDVFFHEIVVDLGYQNLLEKSVRTK